LSLLIAFGFEFVNGFHDTANAVATVIYTRSLRPWTAVILSGICNFLGVFIGGIAVAMSIINLLPVELLVAGGTGAGLAMLLALLLAAIAVEPGDLVLRAAVVELAHADRGDRRGRFGQLDAAGPRVRGGVNWAKAGDVGLALLISPVVGFALAAVLLLAAKKLIKRSAAVSAAGRDAAAAAVDPVGADRRVHGGELRARVERRAEGRRPGDADPDGVRAGRVRAQPRGGQPAIARAHRRWRPPSRRWTP
jgi:phosphate/sulfate permease